MKKMIPTVANGSEAAAVKSNSKKNSNKAGKSAGTSDKSRFKSVLKSVDDENTSEQKQVSGAEELSNKEKAKENILGGKFSKIDNNSGEETSDGRALPEEKPENIQNEKQQSVSNAENKKGSITAADAKGKKNQGGKTSTETQQNKQANPTSKNKGKSQKKNARFRVNNKNQDKKTASKVLTQSGSGDNKHPDSQVNEQQNKESQTNSSTKSKSFNKPLNLKRLSGNIPLTKQVDGNKIVKAEAANENTTEISKSGKISATASETNNLKEMLRKFGKVGGKETIKLSKKIIAKAKVQNPTSTSGQASNENTTTKSQMSGTGKREKLVSNLIQAKPAAGISEKGLAIKGGQIEKTLNKKKANNANVNQDSSNSKSFDLRMGSAVGSKENISRSLEAFDMSKVTSTKASSDFDQQNIMWEQQSSEATETTGEDKESASNANTASSMRLSQMPISNASLRKKVLPGLTKNVIQAASEAKKTPGQWQKHNFVLDDGKSIQLSVRESKGVLQVKMGSMNMDLSKLLQQHMQQIRDHLEQKFGSEIDLQFQDNAEQESSEFSEDSSSKQPTNNRNNVDGEIQPESTTQNNVVTVRNYGYNQMEWTA